MEIDFDKLSRHGYHVQVNYGDTERGDRPTGVSIRGQERFSRETFGTLVKDLKGDFPHAEHDDLVAAVSSMIDRAQTSDILGVLRLPDSSGPRV